MIHKNEPCPCGSGHKYKKCCMAKDQAKTELKNSFRDEVAKVPEAEQLRRDQTVLLSQLQLQADMHERDKAHLGKTGSQKMIEDQIVKLGAMPLTEGTDDIIANLDRQLKGIEGAVAQSAPTWAQGVYLRTLKQVLAPGLNESMEAGEITKEVIEEANTIPIRPSVAKKISGPKLGPIQTDEDNDDLDDD